VVQRRYANGNSELLRSFAHDLVRLRPDVILCIGTEATLAAKEASSTIPIVMMMVGDPVGAGLVRSLGRPGENVTGYSTAFPELEAKRASLLHELIPGIERVGVVYNPNNPLFRLSRPNSDAAYHALRIEPIYVDVTSSAQIENAIAQLAQRRAQALIVLADPVLNTNAATLIGAAQRYALPTVGGGREMVEAGGLISYEPNLTDQITRVIAMIDKVLRGSRPADIPVEQPTKFELIINLKTANTLGLTIPRSLLLRADEVIK
jgi:putative ABC transport system substrate-binding protein